MGVDQSQNEGVDTWLLCCSHIIHLQEVLSILSDSFLPGGPVDDCRLKMDCLACFHINLVFLLGLTWKR